MLHTECDESYGGKGIADIKALELPKKVGYPHPRRSEYQKKEAKVEHLEVKGDKHGVTKEGEEVES